VIAAAALLCRCRTFEFATVNNQRDVRFGSQPDN
jgi:hypothetical protein